MRVLDAFASTGAFSVRAAMAGAEVTSVEKDPAAAAAIGAHASENGVAARVTVRTADAFEDLARLPEASFDIAIVDPPAIAKKKEEQGTARWGFVKLSGHALRALKPGGLLFVSSCAYHLSPTLLEETVRIAGGETGRRLRVVTETFQPPDHPWVLQIPETLYLKSLLVEAE
jgi:23S rRNA (cytosine1962-C5)-methyltransferase